MCNTITSCSTPNGKITCELLSQNKYGSTVFSVHVMEANDDYIYTETHRSYPTGNKRRAMSLYKQFCNKYLRSKLKY